MEIEHLKIVQQLLAEPNLSRAAERLHMTQSALSKRLQSIEAEIGVQLFERRGPRGLAPLPQAIELAAIAERILATWNSGVKNMTRSADEPDHFLLVGPELFLREIVLPWWQKNEAEFPDLQLEVHLSSLERVSLEAVKAGADAAILEHKEELADYVCKPIYTERWGIVSHPGSKVKELSKHLWGTYSMTDNPVDTWLVKRQKLAPPSYRFYWEDLTAIARWVEATPNAASVLPFHVVASLVKKNRVRFEPLGPDSTTKLFIAYSKSNPHKRIIQSLMKLNVSESS